MPFRWLAAFCYILTWSSIFQVETLNLMRDQNLNLTTFFQFVIEI